MNLYAILLIIVTLVFFPFICSYACRSSCWNRQAGISDGASTTVGTRKHNIQALSSLPVFAHSSTMAKETECAVCLAEFREGDKCRLLPVCNHSFHRACVDAWFSFHSTCPLCRAVVESQNPEAAVV